MLARGVTLLRRERVSAARVAPLLCKPTAVRDLARELNLAEARLSRGTRGY